LEISSLLFFISFGLYAICDNTCFGGSDVIALVVNYKMDRHLVYVRSVAVFLMNFLLLFRIYRECPARIKKCYANYICFVMWSKQCYI